MGLVKLNIDKLLPVNPPRREAYHALPTHGTQHVIDEQVVSQVCTMLWITLSLFGGPPRGGEGKSNIG